MYGWTDRFAYQNSDLLESERAPFVGTSSKRSFPRPQDYAGQAHTHWSSHDCQFFVTNGQKNGQTHGPTDVLVEIDMMNVAPETLILKGL